MNTKIINYFIELKNKNKDRRNIKILWRKENKLKRFNLFLYFIRGDILNINMWVNRYLFNFEGLCLGVKYKNFLNINTSIILRNVIERIGIDVTISYYLNRIYNTGAILEYKRKFLWYKSSKLFFLRKKKNKNTQIM